MGPGGPLVRLCTLALLGLVPLTLCAVVEDVFFSAWRTAQAVCLAPVLVLLGWRLARGRLAPRLDRTTLPWALFAGWALAAVSWSVNPWDSLRRGLELAGSVSALWLGIAAARSWPRLRAAAIWAAGLCTVYGLAQAAGYDPMPWSISFGRAFGTLGNPDYYAGHLLVVMPLLAASMAAGTGAGRAEAALAPLLAMGFLLSHVRGAWLASLGCGGWGAFWIWRGGGLAPAERRWLGRAAAVTGVIAVALVAASPMLRGRLGSIVSVGGYDATGRRFLWTVALAEARERPFTGWGTGAFKFQFPRHQSEGAKFHLAQFLPYAYSEHAHSELLQFAAELGLVGVALFLWGLVAWLVPWVRGLSVLAAAGRRAEWWTQWAIGTAIAGAFIYSWVNFPFQIVPTALLFWILIGVSVGRRRLEAAATRGVSSSDETPPAALRSDAEVPAWSLPGPAAQAVGVVLVVFGLGGAWLACADLVGGGYLRHVRGQLEMNHPPVAYEIALRARRMLPHDYRVARSLARIAIVKHDEALADEMLSVRLKLHPYLADAYADRADYDRENGRPDQAMARYEALLKQAPNFITAWVELAGLHVGRGEFGAAAEAYGRAEALQPHNSAWPYREAVFFALAGRFEEGVQAGARTEALDPGSGGLWEGLAVDRGLVVRRMREATRRVPGFATAWIILGQVAFERRDYRQAAQAFGEAVRLRPTVPIIRHNLAAAMGMLDRFREALAQDREAARLDPTFAEAWVGIALSAWVLRDLGTAQHAVGEALRLEPKNARALELRRRIEATASSRL